MLGRRDGVASWPARTAPSQREPEQLSAAPLHCWRGSRGLTDEATNVETDVESSGERCTRVRARQLRCRSVRSTSCAGRPTPASQGRESAGGRGAWCGCGRVRARASGCGRVRARACPSSSSSSLRCRLGAKITSRKITSADPSARTVASVPPPPSNAATPSPSTVACERSSRDASCRSACDASAGSCGEQGVDGWTYWRRAKWPTGEWSACSRKASSSCRTAPARTRVILGGAQPPAAASRRRASSRAKARS
jgi:hypothetical protein